MTTAIVRNSDGSIKQQDIQHLERVAVEPGQHISFENGLAVAVVVAQAEGGDLFVALADGTILVLENAVSIWQAGSPFLIDVSEGQVAESLDQLESILADADDGR